MMPVDFRDVARDLYKLEIVQDNELLLHMPSLPYAIQFDSVARHAELNKLGVMCDRCQEAQEICITDIDAAPARRHKAPPRKQMELSLMNFLDVCRLDVKLC